MKISFPRRKYAVKSINIQNKRSLGILSPMLNMEKDKYAKIIHDELNKLGLEFSRYKERWDKLTRSIETVNKDIDL